MADYLTTDTELTSVANAIRTKGGTSASLVYPTGFVSAIENIPSGGGGNPEAEENDVIFIDYDGTIRYSYSASEFASLSAMPDNPTHAGLTAQGWNWTLADAKAYVAANHILVIGQLYETDDGTTRIYIRIPFDNYSFSMYGSGTWSIDWGDGNTSSSGSPYSHTYTNAGSYVVSFSGTGSSAPYLSNSTQKLLIRRMEFGTNITIPQTDIGYYCCDTIVSSSKFGSGRFNSISRYPQYGLQTLIIPASQTSITYLYMTNYNALKYISFPKLSDFSTGEMSYMQSLKRMCIPSGTTSLPESCFKGCCAMTVATIPDSITSIGNSVFNNCYSLQEVYVMSTTPPTLGTSAFPSNVRTIWVPSASLSTYQGASNWSSYSSKMKGI